MLTGKQKRFLRALGSEMDPIIQVGKGGISENLIIQLDEALEARELVKLRVLKNCLEERSDVAEELSEATDSEVVQKIGHNILFYRKSVEQPRIELPK